MVHFINKKFDSIEKIPPNKKRLERSEFYVSGFVIEDDGMAGYLLIKCPGRPTTEGHTKFLCDALGTEKYNPDINGVIFAYGTLTTSPEENHVLKNSCGYKFRGFFYH